MNKNSLRKYASKFLSLLMSVTLFGTSAPAVNAEDASETTHPGLAPANGELIYSVNPFDEEHAAGYFCISDSIPHGDYTEIMASEETMFTRYAYKNTEREEGTYIDHYNGANMNGEYLDIREYTWQGNNSQYEIGKENGNVDGHNDSATDNWIKREFHFYKAGTLATANPVEVTFKGVMCLQDLDQYEGFTFDQGLVNGNVWLNSLTNVVKTGENTWIGTYENDNTSYLGEREALWAEVEGSPDKPLILTYWAGGGHGAGVNYRGNTLNYKLIDNAKNTLPEGVSAPAPIGCATYSRYTIARPQDEVRKYEFSGWYYDEALTQPVGTSSIVISQDYTLYGTYYRTAVDIATSVQNGTITESENDIPVGENRTVQYSPNPGYALTSVTVDGTPVDIKQYKDSYSFTNLQDDHTVDVVYSEINTDLVKKVMDADGNDIEGMMQKEGNVVTYSLTFVNPLDEEVEYTLTDPLEYGLEEKTVSDGGVYDTKTNTITWTGKVGAKAGVTVSYTAEITAEGLLINNTGHLELGGKKIDSNTVSIPVMEQPWKSNSVGDRYEELQAYSNDYDSNYYGYARVGDNVEYSISVYNPAKEAKTFTITDVLPDELTYLDGSASDDGTYDSATRTLTWTVTLDGDEYLDVYFDCMINSAADGKVKIVNTADVSVDEISEPSNPSTVRMIVDPKKYVYDAENNDIDGEYVKAGDVLTYKIRVTNFAYRDMSPRLKAESMYSEDDSQSISLITVGDIIPEGTEYVADSADASGLYMDDKNTIVWTLPMKYGTTKTVSFKVLVKDPSKLPAKITNFAQVSEQNIEVNTNTVTNYLMEEPVKSAEDADGNDATKEMMMPGEELTYNISFRNTADTMKKFTIKDELPDGVEFVSATDEGKEENNTVVWQMDMNSGSEKTVSVTVRIKSDTKESKLTNTATEYVDHATIDSNEVNVPVVITGKTLLNGKGEDEGFDEDGNALYTVHKAGDTLHYSIYVSNPMTSEQTFTVTDVLQDELEYVESTDSKPEINGQTLTWELPVKALSAATICFDAKIKEQPEDNTILNKATVSITGKTTDTNVVVTPVIPEAKKEVLDSKGMNIDHKIVNVDDVLTYRIDFSNPAPIAKTFEITDTFPDTLEILNVSGDGVKKGNTVTWNTYVEAYEDGYVVVQAKVKESAKGTAVVNTADVTCDEVSVKTNEVETPVIPDPHKTVLDEDGKDIAFDKDGNAVQTVVASGQNLTYAITVENTAEAEKEFTIKDVVPEGMQYKDGTDECTYDTDSRTVTWKIKVAAGKKATVKFDVEVEKAAEGTIVKNHADVTVDSVTVPSNETETPVIEHPEKDVMDSTDRSINHMPVKVGDELTYVVTFTNPSDMKKNATITDTLPEGVKYLSASDEGKYSKSENRVVWNVEVNPHETKRVEVKVKVTEDARKTVIANTAYIDLDKAHVTTANDNDPEHPEPSVKNDVPSKEVLDTKGNDINREMVFANETIEYRIHCANTSYEEETIHVEDVLPEGVSAKEISDGGTVDSENGRDVVVWDLKASANTEYDLTVKAEINESAKGTKLTNSAVVTVTRNNVSRTVETNEVVNYVAKEPVKSVIDQNGKDLNEKTIKNGTKFFYTITMENPSEKKADVILTDTIDKTIASNIFNISDNGMYKNGMITWNLTIKPGESKTVVFEVEAPLLKNTTKVKNSVDVQIKNRDEILHSNETVVTIEKKEIVNTGVGNDLWLGVTILAIACAGLIVTVLERRTRE